MTSAAAFEKFNSKSFRRPSASGAIRSLIDNTVDYKYNSGNQNLGFGMTCKPTDVPPKEEINISSLREKYLQERDKRLTRKGEKQYEHRTGDLTADYEHDPFMPVAPREPVVEDLEVAILGGGWTGVLAGYHLTKLGIANFRHIDHAGDFGGVWYWNRYPGLQCDNDAYCYLPLLEEAGFMHSQLQGQDVPHCPLGLRLHGRRLAQYRAHQAPRQARGYRRYGRDVGPGGAPPRQIL